MPLELTNVIPASPDRVFSVISDLNQAKEWMPAIQKIEPLSQGPFGVGTAWKETRTAGRRTMESTIRVVSFERNSKLGIEVDSRAMTGHIEFNLFPQGNGTQVQYRGEMKGRGLMRLMTGTINRMMAQEDADLLERLKSQVQRTSR
jgi:carbon monoxide dehydrogenase subunit G